MSQSAHNTEIPMEPQTENSAVVQGTEDEQKGPSKSALKKAAKEAEKAKKKAETAARLAAEKAARLSDESVDESKGKYGIVPLIQSTSRTGTLTPSLLSNTNKTGEKRSRISDVNASLDGTNILLRGRVHNLRLQGKFIFWRC